MKPDPNDATRLIHVFDSEIHYEEQPTTGEQRRLIEQVRTLYRKDDLTALLPLGALESLALPGESYKLAFTPGRRSAQSPWGQTRRRIPTGIPPRSSRQC